MDFCFEKASVELEECKDAYCLHICKKIYDIFFSADLITAW